MILPFNDEEEKIYVANLAKANKELQELYDIEGSDKMQILKLLTRLRQICLEPRLVYDNIARVFFPVLLSLVRGRTTGRIVAVS